LPRDQPSTTGEIFPGADLGRGEFLDEQQSRANFQVVSKFVTPGSPISSLLLLMPLAPEAGGIADTHQGGRQFRSQDDPDWKIFEHGFAAKGGGSSSQVAGGAPLDYYLSMANS